MKSQLAASANRTEQRTRLGLVLQHGACDQAHSRLDADPAAGQRPARHHRVPLVEVTRPVKLSIKQLGALGAHGPALQVRYGKRLARAGQVWSRHVSSPLPIRCPQSGQNSRAP